MLAVSTVKSEPKALVNMSWLSLIAFMTSSCVAPELGARSRSKSMMVLPNLGKGNGFQWRSLLF